MENTMLRSIKISLLFVMMVLFFYGCEYNETITWKKDSRYKTIFIKVNKITDFLDPFKGVSWYNGYKPDSVEAIKSHGNQTATYKVTFKRPANNPEESHYGGDGFSEEWVKGRQYFSPDNKSQSRVPASAGRFSIKGSYKDGKVIGFIATNDYPAPVRVTHLEWALSKEYIHIDRLNFDDPLVTRLQWKKGIKMATTLAVHQQLMVNTSIESRTTGNRYFIRYRILEPKTQVMIEETVISGDSMTLTKMRMKR
jgi:hypothetical protein